MSHAKNKVWIHGVFAPKYRAPVLIKDLRPIVYETLHIQLKKMDCHLEEIGGVDDHVHVLFLLSRTKSFAEVFKQMKGASSRFFNLDKIFQEYFNWQKGYGAFSVSESKVPVVKNYIQQQEEHHKKVDYQMEFKGLVARHGLLTDDITFE